MKKIIFIVLTTFYFTIPINSQGTAGENAKYQLRQLIDVPTAGIMERGSVGLNVELLPMGTLITKIEAGVFSGVSIGLSYGGSNIIGSGKPIWYPFPPGVNLRVRILDETILTPTLTVGFDSQGKGEYFKDEKRFSIKAPGFFAAASKNFRLLGYLSLHGTFNYSVIEVKDGDNYLNLMLGAEKTLGSNFSFLIEYNFAFNDNSTEKFGDGKGYLNAGIRWSISDGVTAGFDLRDLIDNKKWSPSFADRAVVIEISQKI